MNSKYKEIEETLYNYKIIRTSIANSKIKINNLELGDDPNLISHNDLMLKINIEQKMIKNTSKIKLIDDAMETLPEVERQVLRLYYIDGHQWNDVADKLGYSTRQCMNLRRKAINKIMQCW